MAQVCSAPIDIETADLPKGVDARIGERLFVLVPSPSWPCSLSPQQRTEPSSSIEHE